MHCYFGIQDYDYEGRKIKTTKIAEKQIDIPYARKHDVADAYCFFLYYIETQRLIYEHKEYLKEWRKRQKNFITNMEKFKYNGD